MRMGLGGRKPPPKELAGIGLMAVGLAVALFALPLQFYVAVLGGIIAYMGHTMRGR